ncbi:MAG: EI24 domain-containing protein [Bacteriovoracaceae bacterium]
MIVFTSFKLGFNLFFRRKINLLWGIIPFILGVILYIAFGAWMFSMLQLFSQDILKLNFMNSWISGITFTTISILVAVAVYFLFNWLFLLCVFFLSYPFHRMISQNTLAELGIVETTRSTFSLDNLRGEVMKVLLNFVLALVVFSCASVPVFSLLAVAASAILVSIQFIDYNWSKRNFLFKDCLADLKLYFKNYLGMGLISLFIMAIPLINVMFMPVLVSVFTTLFYKQRGEA